MISVIVPVYNTERYVGRCIKSVLSSVYKGFELILVNDGSTDRSLLICERYSKKDSRVRVVNQEHLGVSAARNNGLKASRGEWIVFVDSDDCISSDFLSMVVQKKYENGDMLLFDFGSHAKCIKRCMMTDAPSPLIIHRYEKSDRIELVRHLLDMRQLVKGGNTSICSPCAKAYKKSLIDRYSLRFPTDIEICEDRIFNIEYLSRIQSCIYIQRTVYYISNRPDSPMHAFHPDYLQNDIRYQKYLAAALRREGLLSAVERSYCNSVLSNMADVLIRGIFNSDSERTYEKKLRLCQIMQKNGYYQRAIRHAARTGGLPRRVLLFFYKIKCYRTVELICRISGRILEI